MIGRRQVLIGAAGMLAGRIARAEAPDWPRRLVAAAEAQIGVTVTYDPAYARLAYPGGDVPRDRGVCTDVVIRAYRDAFGIDLQRLVHEDMKANFSRYPRSPGGCRGRIATSITAGCRTCRPSSAAAAGRCLPNRRRISPRATW